MTTLINEAKNHTNINDSKLIQSFQYQLYPQYNREPIFFEDTYEMPSQQPNKYNYVCYSLKAIRAFENAKLIQLNLDKDKAIAIARKLIVLGVKCRVYDNSALDLVSMQTDNILQLYKLKQEKLIVSLKPTDDRKKNYNLHQQFELDVNESVCDVKLRFTLPTKHKAFVFKVYQREDMIWLDVPIIDNYTVLSSLESFCFHVDDWKGIESFMEKRYYDCILFRHHKREFMAAFKTKKEDLGSHTIETSFDLIQMMKV